MHAWRLAFTVLAAVVLSMASLATMPFGVTHAAAPLDLTVTDCTSFAGTQQNRLLSLGTALAQAARNDGSTITFACDGYIRIPRTIEVSNTLTIKGNRHSVTLSGERGPGNILSRVQVFSVRDGNLTLDGLTVTLGLFGDNGGGVHNDRGTVTITNSTFSNNSSEIVGTDRSGRMAFYPGMGGGVFNDGGTVTITNSTFSNNSALQGGSGGGVYNADGTVTITNSTFSGNHGSAGGGGSGGGVDNSGGTVTITNSTFSGNGAGSGGGVKNYPGAMTITNSRFDSNEADSGGGVWSSKGTVTISHSTFSGNGAGSGGGVYNADGTVSITNDTFLANKAQSGGGVWSRGGTLSITGSNFVANIAGGGHNAAGGAVILENQTSATTESVTITDSTFLANAALGVDGTSYGGGVSSTKNTALTITNSTFSGNVAGLDKTSTDPALQNVLAVMSAFSVGGFFSMNIGGLVGSILSIFGVGQHDGSSGYGGGVWNDNGTATITSSTFTANQSVGSGAGGGGISSSGSSASTTIQNSIVADNAADTPGTANCFGAFTDGGYNLATWQGECGFTSEKHDVWTPNPGLASLDNNGGSTPTLALLGSSPAIDQIPRGTNGCGSDGQIDQRGYTRPQGSACDIGAVELDNAPPITTPSLTPKANSSGTYTANVRVTLSGGNDAGGSGVKAIYYKLDNGGQQTYTAPISITSNGQHTLTYWSVDKAGNTEVAQVMTFKLDKTPYLLYIGLGLAGVVIVGLIVVWVLRRRKAGAGGTGGGRTGGAGGTGGEGGREPVEERTLAGVREERTLAGVH